MARPARHNAEYFSHTANLRNDRRIKAIRTQCGATGYGVLVMLLEALTDANHTQLDTEELELELLAGDFGVSVTEIHSLLQIGEKVGFFARNTAGFLICPDLNDWLAEVFEKRNRARNAAKPPKSGVSVTETPVTVTENPQSKVKESKELPNGNSESKTPPTPGVGVFQKKIGVPVSEVEPWADAPSESPPVAPPPPAWLEEARELAAGMYGFWALTHLQADAQRRVLEFVQGRYAAGAGPQLAEQFVAYRAFKTESQERAHSWKNWIAAPGDGQLPGWQEANWPDKLTTYRKTTHEKGTPTRRSPVGADASQRHHLPAVVSFAGDAA
ncbi:Lin1244/Lin1753 domain-containing protein [Hymenobacter nivis]|nr:Lin1244/Lin1753 domain-containing protein [Hymenobacter nivis]